MKIKKNVAVVIATIIFLVTSSAMAFAGQLPLPDTVRVGDGNTYTSLTKTGGLFAALNGGLVTLNQNLVILITSDLSEDGTYSLTNTGLNGYSVTIKSSVGIVRNISNSSNLTKSLISIVGAKRIVIDGSYQDIGQFLRFINTHSDSTLGKAAISISGSVDSVTIKNIIAESNQYGLFYQGNDNAVIFLGTGTNKNIRIQRSTIRNATTGTTGIPRYGILSMSSGNQVAITDNDIFNFASKGISLRQVANGVLIDGNHLFYNMPYPAREIQLGIEVGDGAAHYIQNNYVGGSARYCAGPAWLNGGQAVQSFDNNLFSGIQVTPPGTVVNFVIGNTIQNIHITSVNGSFNGIATNRFAKVSNNIVGHPSTPNSIINDGNQYTSNMVGITTSGIETSEIEVSDNIIANMTATGVPTQSTGAGIIGLGMYAPGKNKILRNQIHHLNCHSTQGNANATISGMRLWGNNLASYTCEENTIWSLKATNTANNLKVYGIVIEAASTQVNSLNRNRIYGLESLSLSGGVIAGIHNSNSNFKYSNNQLALDNSSNTNNMTICGFYSPNNGLFCNSSYYYNTIYIGGNSVDASSSYGLYIDNYQATQKFYNNLVYNNRSSANGGHYAISVIINSLSSNWSNKASDYNFFVTPDTAKVVEWAACCTHFPKSMSQFRMDSKGDSSSFSATNIAVPASSLFVDPSTGNLNIITTNPLCWTVNGKGMPVQGIGDDFDSPPGTRSISVATGSTDIGSDEFNTTTTPLPLDISGVHQPGGADTLSFHGRLVAVINWGNSGTLPALANMAWYSGTWPNDTTNDNTVINARFMSGFISIPATGGTGYNYSFKLFYDSAMLGKVLNSGTMVLNKRQSTLTGSWASFPATLVNTISRTISVSNLNSFSEFTATDANATLSALSSYICAGGNSTITSPGTGATYQWQLNTGSGFNNITDNSNFSGSNSNSLQVTNVPSAWYGYQLRCLVDGTASILTVIRIRNTWTGAVNNSWENPANWSCGIVPDQNTDVIINSGIVQLNSNTTIRTLSLNSGVIFTVGAGYQLTITH